jgi:serine protease inhibitor
MRGMRHITLIAAAALASACGGSTEPGPPAQLTGLPRVLSADELRVSRAANQFTFRLFQRLNAAQPSENVFVSPLSVSFSLGMAMNGAAGQTFDEMRAALGFDAAELAEINAGYSGLMGLQAGLDASTTFQIANSIWYRNGFTVHAAFIDQVREAFSADVNASPFDASTITQVNNWVSGKTNGRIPTILESITDANVMFLINAIYFKGSWREAFKPAQTRDASFASISGPQTVKMMTRTDDEEGSIRFSATPTATVGELSYGNGAFVMTVLLPNGTSTLESLAASLDTAAWTALVAPMQERRYRVELPRFTITYERQLKDDLIALGMNIPFSENGADFSRMTPQQAFISFVKHKSFVQVDEEGTEAAAVTNTGISVTSLPPCLCVDRPFIFAIRERFSGTILFIGKVVRIP